MALASLAERTGPSAPERIQEHCTCHHMWGLWTPSPPLPQLPQPCLCFFVTCGPCLQGLCAFLQSYPDKTAPISALKMWGMRDHFVPLIVLIEGHQEIGSVGGFLIEETQGRLILGYLIEKRLTLWWWNKKFFFSWTRDMSWLRLGGAVWQKGPVWPENWFLLSFFSEENSLTNFSIPSRIYHPFRPLNVCIRSQFWSFTVA